MPKGMFTQGVCVLLDRTPEREELEKVLADHGIRKKLDANEEWAFGGPSLVLMYLAESNGLVSVDVIDRPWPDHMGDVEEEPMLFGAWSMGYFGPFAFPGGLQRAAQQSWAWEAGPSMVEKHRSFIRIRSSYAFGAEDDDPIIPEGYQPLPELEFVTKVATQLLDLPGALCYFNPNGELLLDQDSLRNTLNFGWANDFPPLDAWSNVRMFSVNDQWSLMDTVGNGQLDLPDVEACFHTSSYDFNDAANFLRNVSLYLLNHGEILNDGDTMDGPGDIRWQVCQFDNGMCDPPRKVLRWLPMDDREIPQEILNAADSQ